MADILAALEELDKADKKKKPMSVKENTKRNASAGSRRKAAQPRPARPSSLPPTAHDSLRPNLSPGPRNSYYSERPPSSRRISFADPPRPSLRRLRLPTKTESLSSGFPYDSRLFKYGVTAEEWNHFSSEIVQAAQVPLHTHVPVLSWTWTFHKSKVLKGVKRQMLYESSDLSRELRRWNKLFKRQGFQVTMELPNMEDERERGGEREVVGDTKEEKAQAKLESRRFRMVITPNAEKTASSIYSRSSSLTRSVTGEGAATTAKNIPPPPPEDSKEEQVEESEDKDDKDDEKGEDEDG